MSEKNLNSISSWLNSGEYKSDISNIREKIMADCYVSTSEATTASIFENTLYHLIKQKTNISIDISKEVSISGIKDARHKFSTTRGRIDALVNNLVIEYKHHSKLTKETEKKDAYTQVENYLYALKKNENQEYNAILTDGMNIAYFSFSEEEVKYTRLSTLTNRDVDLIINAILNNNRKKFTPKNILRDFFIKPEIDSISKSIAMSLHENLINKSTEKTKMLFEEWQTLMHLSIDDEGKGNDIEKRRRELSRIFQRNIVTNVDEYLALYALQTTYAIIVKMIACKIVDKLEYNQNTNYYVDLTNVSSKDLQVFFERVENGYSYRNSNLINFLEGDFFSWYSDENQWSIDFSDQMKLLIKLIDEYSSFSFNIVYEPIDIFKDLYMSIIPDSIRHSTGEYFTPKWLADHVVKSAILEVSNAAWKAIDPCCGSGIFIIALIREIIAGRNLIELSANEKESIKSDILNRVYGVDINPLSVLSARVGYYLALQPLGEMNDIEIPIYLGDSAIMPSIITIDNIQCYKHTIYNAKKSFDFVLPKRFVDDSQFGKTMNDLQACVNTKQEKVLYNAIVNEFNETEIKSKKLLNEIQQLAKNLVVLKRNEWDGIWIRIIANFMYIARLAGFDIIVGNPPWVKWEHLPSAYANRIKHLCDVRHIFSGQGQFGGTQLNICALISNVTATNWLKKDGVLAFLMPDSIMSQNSYEGFRKFYIDYDNDIKLFLQKLDKWEAPLRPFSSGDKAVTQDFNTYYYSYKEVDYFKGLPVSKISKTKGTPNAEINQLDSINKAKKYLTFEKTRALQLSNKSSAFSYQSNEFDFSTIIGETAYLYRTGVEFTPQEIYMLTAYSTSDKANHYRFKNMKFARSKYKVTDTPANGWNLPNDNIYPIVTGPKLSMFKFDTANQFCILPYDKKDTKNTIESSKLQKTQKELFIYLTNHFNMINEQSNKSKSMRRGDDFYALSKIGPYTFAPNIVAAKDNGKFCAAVIKEVETPWGKSVMPICVKHTIIISQRKDKSFIDAEEANYICGILNSTIVREYFSMNFKSNGISLNKSNIYIPLFDKNNKLHVEIARLAKKASNEVCDIEKISSNITDIYIKICKNRNT